MNHVSLRARHVGVVPIGKAYSEPTTACAEHFGESSLSVCEADGILSHCPRRATGDFANEMRTVAGSR